MSCWCGPLRFQCTECEASSRWSSLGQNLKLTLVSLKESVSEKDDSEARDLILKLTNQERVDKRKYGLEMVPEDITF